MKFLVLSTPVPGLPPPEDPEAFFKESTAYLDALLSEGAADCVYITPDGGGMAVMNKNHHLSKPVLIGEIQEDGQFLVVWETEGTVPGDAWSDFLEGSKDVIADWTPPISCGNYNTVTKKCSGQNY